MAVLHTQGVIYWGYKMKYITAIFLALSVVCGALAYYYHTKANSYCELWKNSQANTDFLIEQRRKDYENTLAISERNRQLEEAAKMDKSSFDWNYDISHSPVILRLQSNKGSLR